MATVNPRQKSWKNKRIFMVFKLKSLEIRQIHREIGLCIEGKFMDNSKAVKQVSRRVARRRIV